jgi:hypothetical protein
VAAIVGHDVDFRVPLKLLGGLHYLVLEGRASWDDVPRALDEHTEFLRAFVRERSVQTNEVQRSWMLLPCFLEVARRTGAQVFDLIELGPSAGFNLLWDRYRYGYERGTWGADDAVLELRGEERLPVPLELLQLAPRVRSRVGVDIEPVDVTRDEEARTLKAFVWPDQMWRLTLVEQAIAAVRRERPRVIAGDAAEELPRLLAGRRRDAVTLVYQTAVIGYMAPKRRELVYAALAQAGRNGGLAYVGTHSPLDGSDRYYGLAVQTWPGGGEREIVAHADFHGAWIEWLPR